MSEEQLCVWKVDGCFGFRTQEGGLIWLQTYKKSYLATLIRKLPNPWRTNCKDFGALTTFT